MVSAPRRPAAIDKVQSVLMDGPYLAWSADVWLYHERFPEPPTSPSGWRGLLLRLRQLRTKR
jgi:hypothetical protein